MHIEQILARIYNLTDLRNKVIEWRQHRQKIVFTNGCFDILHAGHVTYLAAAADAGDKLIIGLNADSSIRHLKGANRPVTHQDERALLLAALQFTDAVILFEEETPLRLITALQPDVLVKGGDYTEDTIIGAKEVKASGGMVKIIPFVAGLSTSGIIAKIKEG
jgi:rfaE bifunctional protein nucleotidyltransferase chain/domain